ALLIAGVLAPLAGAPSALAQPARCDVHILRSPAPVRRVIEARVKREPSCETSIALRVVPTTSGLYLLAHTPSGRTYELVAPDAETAAELVATWATRREAAPAAAQVLPLAPPAIGPPSPEASPAAVAPIDEAQ